MFCIFCKSTTKVTNSRSKSELASTWRRRQCISCTAVFSTEEKPDFSLSIKVKDSSGKYKPFSEEKLLISICECLSHKKNAIEASKSMLKTVIASIQPLQKQVDTVSIARATYTVLRRYDKTSSQVYKAKHPIF